MVFRKGISFLFILSVLLLSGCFDANDDGSTKVDDISVEVLYNPDSTVQIYVRELPFLHSWELSKNGTVIDTLWNTVWVDTLFCTENTTYDIQLLNMFGERLGEKKELKPTVVEGDTEVGITFPNDVSKLVIGTNQTVLWNPESFNTQDLVLRVQYLYRSDDGASSSNTIDFELKNSGKASIPLKTSYYEYSSYKNSYLIKFYMYPKGENHNSVYAYRTNEMPIVRPSYSEVITFPVLGDTVHVGRTSYITWDKESIKGSEFKLSFRDKDLVRIVDLKDVENSGEYVWAVPNVDEGYYHMKIDYKDSKGAPKTVIGFPFYIKK